MLPRACLESVSGTWGLASSPAAWPEGPMAWVDERTPALPRLGLGAGEEQGCDGCAFLTL